MPESPTTYLAKVVRAGNSLTIGGQDDEWLIEVVEQQFARVDDCKLMTISRRTSLVVHHDLYGTVIA
jgi:hypothetical protein